MGGEPHYLYFGFVVISVANLVVILLLIVVFAAAVALRWPGRRPETIDQSHDNAMDREAEAG